MAAGNLDMSNVWLGSTGEADLAFYSRQMNDPSSFAWQAMSMPYRMSALQSAASTGDITRAKGIYDDIVKFYADNSDNVARASMLDKSTHPIMGSIQRSAEFGIQRQFDQIPVMTAAGQTTTGELFGPNGSYQKLRDDEMRSQLFTDRTIQATKSDDTVFTGMLNKFVDPVIKKARAAGGETPPGAYSSKEMADLFASRGEQDLRDLGSDALGMIVSSVLDNDMKNGTAASMYRTLVTAMKKRRDAFAEEHPDREPDGPGEAAAVISSVRSMMKAAAGDDRGQVDDDVARAYSLALSSVAADPRINLNDGFTRLGMDELMVNLAKAERAGVKLLPVLDNHGTQVSSAFREYIVARSRGLDAPIDNVFTKLRVADQMLGRLIAPGWSPAKAEGAKADPRWGVGTSGGVLGATSGSPGLDAAAASVYKALYRHIATSVASDGGPSGEEAVVAALSDSAAMAAVARELSLTMGISPDAAALLADGLKSSWRTSDGALSPVGLEQALVSAAFRGEGGDWRDEARLRPLRNQLRSWYGANMGPQGRYFDELLSDWDELLYDPVIGYGAMDRNARADVIHQAKTAVKKEMADAAEKGLTAADIAEARMCQGRYYYIAGFTDAAGNYKSADSVYERDARGGVLRDKSGRPVVKPAEEGAMASYTPVVATAFGDLRKVDQPLSGLRIPGTQALLPSFGAGLYTPGREGAMARAQFREYMGVLRQLYLGQLKEGVKEGSRPSD